MSLSARTLLLTFLLLLAGCDVLEQVSGVDPVKTVLRDNPVDPVSTRPLVFGLDSSAAVVGTVRPSIRFMFAPGVVSYSLQISTTVEFSAPLAYEEQGITEAVHRIAKPLANHGRFHWRTRPTYSDGTGGGWSVVKTLGVELPVPKPSGPVGPSYVPLARPTLAWAPVDSSASYDWQVSEEPQFGVLTDSGRGAGDAQVLNVELGNNSKYYWRVRAIDGSVPGDWSETASFTVLMPKPAFRDLGGGAAIRQAGDQYLDRSVVGDFNDDGRVDLVTIVSGNLLIFYQSADGQLNQSVSLDTGHFVRGLLSQDLDGDGISDLVVIGNSGASEAALGGKIGVFTHDQASHSFQPPVWTSLAEYWLGAVTFLDRRDDLLVDLAVTVIDGTGTSHLVLLSQKAGNTFGSPMAVAGVTPYYRSGYPVGQLAAGDMNNDGRQDVVFLSGKLEIAILTQWGPTNSTVQSYIVQTSYWPWVTRFAIGDLNGDGANDLVVADPGNSPKMNLFFQQADGTLNGPILQASSANSMVQVLVRDVDRDGLNDIVVDAGYTDIVYYQSPEHSFGDNFINGFISHALLVACEDWNNDGYTDFLGIGNNWDTLKVVLQTP